MKFRKSVAACALALTGVLGGTMVFGSPVGAATVAHAAASYNGGQFCKDIDEGRVITSDNGKQIQCRYVDGYHRWVIK